MKRIVLIGAGPDGRRWLTREAEDTLAGCEVLIGARRLMDAQKDHPAQKHTATQPQAVRAAVDAHPAAARIGILLSGDTGFFSGAKGIVQALGAENVTVLPGVGAHQLLCARLGIPWDGAGLVSVHGREGDVCARALVCPKTLVLTGENMPPQAVCAALDAHGLGFVRVTVGAWLGYPQEHIARGEARTLASGTYDPFSVLLIENGQPLTAPRAAPGLPDGLFKRAGAPMTKREVRAVSIAQLGPRDSDTVWDIGAGSGSVSVECALLCRAGRVFAIERNGAACAGIAENRTRFGVWHLRVVPGEAPEILAGLPAPDRVFVGGSGGSLGPILRAVQAANPLARVVVNAVTLQTLHAAMDALAALGYAAVECTQVSAARARPVGAYHRMEAQNPVFIVSAGGAPE